MEGLLSQDVNFILWLQQLSPALDLPFRALTFLGEEDFLILLLPLLYWSVDRQMGLRLGLLFLLSTYLNGAVKLLMDQPRPFQVDPRVRELASSAGGGFPSQHTQSTVVVWGYLAARVQRPAAWALAVALMLLVPLSRLYLGVHFPTDLAGGYLLGGIVLAAGLALEPLVRDWLGRASLAWQLGLALALPVLLAMALPSPDEIALTATGMLLGTGVGLALERRWLGFESDGDWRARAARLALGLAVLLALRFGLKAAFAGLDPEPVFRFLRYALMGLWFALGAPRAFVALGLAGSRREERRQTALQ